MSDKQRIIDLQKQVRIMRTALERIKAGVHNPHTLADDVLSEIMPLDRKYPLQGVVGHERRPRR